MNRYQDLEPVLLELAALIDDPDEAGEPEEAIARLKTLTQDAARIAAEITLEDFEEEYAEEDETEV